MNIGFAAATLDFSLQQDAVRWTDLSNYQPSNCSRQARPSHCSVSRCFACHGISTRLAGRRQNADSWFRDVDYMRDSMRYFLRDQIDDATARELASYLTTNFGLDSSVRTHRRSARL